jgi:glycosyltransferase involved in cell wall biosynthesis
MSSEISIVIPTIAVTERRDGLYRAIGSIVEQQGVDALPVVVVNGSRFDPALVAELAADPRIHLLQIAEGNVSRARHAGLLASTRPFFGFLDDDDELLPGGLAARHARFADDVDVVVSNGYFLTRQDEQTEIVPRDIMARIEADPLGAFMDCNWFSAASGLFRAASIPASLFDFDLRFYECTFIALRLMDQRARIRFCETFGFRMHQSTPDSATKTKAYVRAQPDFVRRMRTFRRFGTAYDRHCVRKLANSLNLVSRLEREWGHYHRAWFAHLQCLASGGLRFLPYTRHLLMPRRTG